VATEKIPASASTSPSSLPLVSPADRKRLLGGLLKGVSRSFYLTLRVLPGNLRTPIGLAYLLARAADTISDTRILPPDERLSHLLGLRAQVEGPADAESLARIGLLLTDKQSLPKERVLLSSLPQIFSMLETVGEEDRALIRSVVGTLSQGMEADLTTFPTEDSQQIVALPDSAALDRYTYLVAGCVGEFWTAITMAHTPGLSSWDDAGMSEMGIRFGKALQMTNVLRDVPKDLRLGRCYFPQEQLAAHGITPDALLDPSTSSQARPMLVDGIRIALGHFQAAEEYVLAIPRRHRRLRLAALWPVLIGLATLAELARNGDWLDPNQPSKVTRSWVYGMLARSLLSASSNSMLRSWIEGLRRRVEQAL
jgi:farnesyl-diphosphate farnesyltransferase